MTRRDVGVSQFAAAADVAESARYPLNAIYLLYVDDPSSAAAAVSRQLMSPTEAVPALMQHLKLGAVMSREDPGRLVKQVAAIVREVPVYELRIAHDWAVVGQVVERVSAWHAQLHSA